MPDRGRLLTVYMQDHLALMTGETELIARTLRENAGGPLGEFLDRLAADQRNQRAVAEQILKRLGTGPSRVKQGLAWLTEKVGRLKLNGTLTEYSPLSRQLELEALAATALDRLAMWETLDAVFRADPRFEDFEVGPFADESRRHLDALQEHRRRTQAATFM